MSQPETLPPKQLTYDHFDTPLGGAMLLSDEREVLRAFNWSEEEDHVLAWARRAYPGVTPSAAPAPPALRQAFEAYFAGDIRALSAVAWDAAGTDFQRRVWKALCEIPVGETWSYARLAAHVGRPSAVRAVGTANGANPVAILVPCHRVIGSNGALTGYAGGLERKRWLLVHEGVAAQDLFAA